MPLTAGDCTWREKLNMTKTDVLLFLGTSWHCHQGALSCCSYLPGVGIHVTFTLPLLLKQVKSCYYSLSKLKKYLKSISKAQENLQGFLP